MMMVELGKASKTMKMSKEEMEWREERDQEIPMDAQRIKADKARYLAAIGRGRDRLDGLAKIVGDDDADEVKS